MRFQLHTTTLRNHMHACYKKSSLQNWFHKLTHVKGIDITFPFCFFLWHWSHHAYRFRCEWCQKCNVQISIVCCNVVLKSNVSITILKRKLVYLNSAWNIMLDGFVITYHDILNNSTGSVAINCNMSPFFLKKNE